MKFGNVQQERNKMATHNDITGDALVSRPGLSEVGQKTWDTIFTKRKTNGGWKPPLTPLQSQEENRIDIIGQNGNDGLHYEEEK